MFGNFKILRQDFIIFSKSKFRTYFDFIWKCQFYYFPKTSIICHVTDVKITQETPQFN